MNSDSPFYKELPLFSYWDAQRAGMPIEDSIEFILYGRVWVTGQSGQFGPYFAINTMADQSPRSLNGSQPAIVVHVDRYHLGADMHEQLIRFSESYETDGYHGGSLLDEIAALVSLILGTRMKAGQIIRRFDGANGTGVPTFWGGLGSPYLPERTDQRRVVPDSRDAVGIEEIDQLDVASRLKDKDRRALMRAARLYQRALWIAEEDPALAWLLLVSAVETIAQRVKTADADLTALLTQAKPDLVAALEALHPGTVAVVAQTFGNTLQATRGFREAVGRFLPPAPAKRPPAFAQVDWNWARLKRGIDQIYDLRSKALHEGIPFPGPMCEPPHPTVDADGKQGVEHELPQGDSWCGISGWKKREMPMHLHIFAHITRGVLLNWMRETAATEPPRVERT